MDVAEDVDDFEEGEWEELLAEGDASESLDGEMVLEELKELRKER